jgi:hypothetical protein
VIPTDLPFEEVWLRDFEFIARPGNRPDVVCLVAIELRSGRTLRLWRDKLGARPPHRIDRGVLCISFVENAESACHLALGWKRPARVLDLSPTFRNITNGRTTPAGKGLLGALRYYGIDTISAQHKDAMRDQIIQGWPFTPEEQAKILDYCQSDVEALKLLLPRILADPDFDLALRCITASSRPCPRRSSIGACRSIWMSSRNSPTSALGARSVMRWCRRSMLPTASLSRRAPAAIGHGAWRSSKRT